MAQSPRLAKEILHPSMAQPVWQHFARGNYADAVFEAMKAVEIAVRDAAGYPDNSVGVPMMKDAFNPQNGPLRDPNMADACCRGFWRIGSPRLCTT
jgi:uncharacterized protein (TIGR02391 family)